MGGRASASELQAYSKNKKIQRHQRNISKLQFAQENLEKTYEENPFNDLNDVEDNYAIVGDCQQ